MLLASVKLHLTLQLMCPRHYIWTACLVLATGVSMGPWMAQEIDFLDLTNSEANPLRHKKFASDPDCTSGGGSGGGTIGCPPAFYPFHLTLLNVEADRIQVGGELVALLRLVNVGHDSAWVPWGTDPDQIEMPDSQDSFTYLQSELTADLSQEDGVSAHFQCPVSLYGAKGAGGTLKEIRPGEFVEVLVKVAINSHSADPQSKSLKPGEVRLKFTWTEWDCKETYAKCGIHSSQNRLRMLSSNAVDVEFIGAKAPH